MTFKKSLWTSLLLLSIIPLFCLGMICTFIATENINNREIEVLTDVAKTSGISFEDFFDAQDREINVMSHIKRLEECLEGTYEHTLTDEQYKESVGALKRWIDADDYYLNAFLLDDTGKIISSDNGKNIGTDFGNSDIFINTMSTDTVYTSGVTKSLLHEDIDVVTMSIKMSYKNYEGVLVLETTLGFYYDIVDEIYTGETGSSFIIDQNNRYICSTHNEIPTKISNSSIINSILGGYKNGEKNIYGSDIYYNQDNEKRVFSYYVLEKFDWVFVTSQAVSEIEQPIYMIIISMISVLLIVLIGVVFICKKLLNTFIGPINELQSVFKMATKENRYVACEVEGVSEFAELADGYNNMIGTLNSSFEELAELYEEITAQEEEIRSSYEMLVAEQKKIKKLAMYDTITDLPNRASFEQRLEMHLWNKVNGGAIYIDLDSFKSVNDIFGHPIGDLCLVEVANRLSSADWGFDMVSRIGGDEFLLIKLGKKDEIEEIAQRILKTIGTAFDIGELSINLTASIGISLFPEDGNDIIDIIKYAEMAMYHAKEVGKNRYCFYDNAMKEELSRQMTIIGILRNAIETGEVFSVYQPEISVQNKKACAFETLMRVHNKEYGFISPIEFIPIAESSGLIIELGSWILKNTCIFTKQLIDSGADIDFASVNVSFIQLENVDFVKTVIEILEETKLPPNYLQIEITESVLMKHYEENIKKLKELRSHGIAIALDDFGTGYSSMNYLFELPIDILKIDKSFIDEVTKNPKKQTICQAIIQMAHMLDIRVVAEGIEDQEQCSMLEDMGCDIIQGYLFSAPLKEEEFVLFYQENGRYQE